MKRIILVFMILSVTATVAAAQGTIEVGGSLKWLQEIMTAVVTAIIGVAVTWGVYLAQRYTGVRIDTERANELARAAQRQAASLIADGFARMETEGKITVSNSAIAGAVNEVLRSVPEAVKHFNLNKDDIAKRVVDYIPMVPDTAVTSQGVVVTAPKV